MTPITQRTNQATWAQDTHCLTTVHAHPAGTIEQYLNYPQRLCHDLDITPWQVTTTALMEWLAAHADWAPNTHKRALGSLRGFYSWALDAGHIANAPTATLKRVKVHAGVPRPCPESVLAQAHLRAPTHDDRMGLPLAAATGILRAELAATQGRHVEYHSDVPWLRVIGKGHKERTRTVARRRG